MRRCEFPAIDKDMALYTRSEVLHQPESIVSMSREVGSAALAH